MSPSALDKIGSAFEQAFREIAATRMRGLPLLNPALSVRLFGWREWRQRQFGVLLTPWSMSLVCLPGSGGGPGVEHLLELPLGSFRFVEAETAGVGAFGQCSLFSPVLEFADQAAAEATAEAALEALFRTGPRHRAPQAADRALPSERGISRRELLRGAFGGRRP